MISWAMVLAAVPQHDEVLLLLDAPSILGVAQEEVAHEEHEAGQEELDDWEEHGVEAALGPVLMLEYLEVDDLALAHRREEEAVPLLGRGLALALVSRVGRRRRTYAEGMEEEYEGIVLGILDVFANRLSRPLLLRNQLGEGLGRPAPSVDPVAAGREDCDAGHLSL